MLPKFPFAHSGSLHARQGTDTWYSQVLGLRTSLIEKDPISVTAKVLGEDNLPSSVMPITAQGWVKSDKDKEFGVSWL